MLPKSKPPAGKSIFVSIDCQVAICIISQIQLASKHPQNVGTARQTAVGFARAVQAQVVELWPEVSTLLEMGWNRDFDISDQ